MPLPDARIGRSREPGAAYLRFPGRLDRVTQGLEPVSEPNTKRFGELAEAKRLAIESRPPLDEGAVAVDNRSDPQRRPKACHRQRGRVAKFVGLRPLDVGLREQPLTNPMSLIEHVPDRADGVSGLPVLDPALARAADPHRIVVEISNDF